MGFSAFFSSENDVVHHSSPYASVDCTLSLGTPSTRLCNDDYDRRFSSHTSNPLGWDFLHGSKKGGGGGGGGSNLLVRRCANCDTTSTPLWRNGPRGPKVPIKSIFMSVKPNTIQLCFFGLHKSYTVYQSTVFFLDYTKAIFSDQKPKQLKLVMFPILKLEFVTLKFTLFRKSPSPVYVHKNINAIYVFFLLEGLYMLYITFTIVCFYSIKKGY